MIQMKKADTFNDDIDERRREEGADGGGGRPAAASDAPAAPLKALPRCFIDA